MKTRLLKKARRRYRIVRLVDAPYNFYEVQVRYLLFGWQPLHLMPIICRYDAYNFLIRKIRQRYA